MVIVSLNLGLETWSRFLLPCLEEALQIEPSIRVLMDCLCFCHDYKRTHFVAWKMKEFGDDKSWTKFMKVSYQDFHIDSLDYYLPLLPLYMSDEILITAITTNRELQVIIYNQSDSSVKRIELLKDVTWLYYTKGYVESLVSPCCKSLCHSSCVICVDAGFFNLGISFLTVYSSMFSVGLLNFSRPILVILESLLLLLVFVLSGNILTFCTISLSCLTMFFLNYRFATPASSTSCTVDDK
ncbi:hypothetical protein RIF29_39210 [Crotalaria pallida]|uniref:Uncharacterized protein n=1 Tax=Crotalaria pallida TaxID=3830 RepID=A0AAN9E1A1_CROPI